MHGKQQLLTFVKLDSWEIMKLMYLLTFHHWVRPKYSNDSTFLNSWVLTWYVIFLNPSTKAHRSLPYAFHEMMICTYVTSVCLLGCMETNRKISFSGFKKGWGWIPVFLVYFSLIHESEQGCTACHNPVPWAGQWLTVMQIWRSSWIVLHVFLFWLQWLMSCSKICQHSFVRMRHSNYKPVWPHWFSFGYQNEQFPCMTTVVKFMVCAFSSYKVPFVGLRVSERNIVSWSKPCMFPTEIDSARVCRQ